MPHSEAAPPEDKPALRRVSAGRVITAIVLSLAGLGLIALYTIEPDTWDQMSHVNPWGLALAALTVVLRVFCGTWRLAHTSKGRLRWMGAFRAQLAWDFFSNVTPSAIGGGPIAPAYIVRDNHISLGDATSIMLFAMLLDQIWFVLAIITVLYLGLHIEIIPASFGTLGDITFTAYFVGFILWVLVFGYLTLVRPALLRKIIDQVFRVVILRRFRNSVLRMMSQLQKRAHILRTQRVSFYVKGFALTIAVWLSRYLLVVAILWSVSPSVDQVLVLLRTIAMMLGALMLPTPGGAGGIEGLYALMVGPLIPEALVAPTLLTWRLLGYYIFLAAGAYITVHQVERRIRRTKDETVQSENAPHSA